ncbi:thioredoxin domain-containing protein [Chryseolinea sp. H1M3-3]|uniref:thioredoxin domain-containing protein n=1 Tax=Chryseolinea sp. H1M3-3 TaxID=3034144 RepID=UPI0023EAB138|nr:thioredoxin domain-containing protein [Chryseolinea sp. H1M3-3]
MANKLIHATSPYLLQHAHNPVDWFEWGTEALSKAVKEDKPILVSIGYSSCHWCHVMERESFEKESVAEVMNQSFICIKVDREERPDIDQIYMEAVHILGVQGGWPLNVFLTPDQKPFFGGTYFTPQVWMEVLKNISNAYQKNRKQIEDTAEELRLHLLTSEVERYKQKATDSDLISDLYESYNKLQLKFDKKWGGLEKSPKFIMPSIWLFLLRLSHLTKNAEAYDHILFTLRKISMGGIYDQVGGGFSRYSVDRYWFAPHFEKMLYDNAQLLSLYSEAYAISKDNAFKTVIYETFEWLQREMTHSNGGFYSALDADSEGVEGKFYTWTKTELKEILGPDEKIISTYYSVKDEGNWEHGNNILMRTMDEDKFLQDNSLTPEQWNPFLQNIKSVLLKERAKRVRPGLDDKVIASWNAMTVCGLVDAYRTFADEMFLNAAVKNIHFLEKELMEGNKIYRSYKNKRSNTVGFLDDYAYLIQALIKLYQVTFDEYWLNRAAQITQYTSDQFFDPSDGFFFYTAIESEQLISRKKEIFDNVIPSSNAVMTQNLHYLSTFFDREDWKKIATQMTESLSHLIKGEPGFMSYWAIVYTELKKGLAEIVLTGKNISTMRSDFLQHFLPFAIVQGSENGSNLPLVKDKTPINGEATFYVCFNKTCKQPVHSVKEALQQLA